MDMIMYGRFLMSLKYNMFIRIIVNFLLQDPDVPKVDPN